MKLALALVVATTACVHPRPAPVLLSSARICPLSAPSSPPACAEIAVEQGAWIAASAATQRRRAEELSRALVERSNPPDRLALALLLLRGDPGVRDDERAMRLLAGVVWDEPDCGLVADLALAIAAERRDRVAERAEWLQTLEEERARAAAFAARLEVVKDIERDIDVRALGGPGGHRTEDPPRR